MRTEEAIDNVPVSSCTTGVAVAVRAITVLGRGRSTDEA